MSSDSLKLAVLIDADNVSGAIVKELLEEIAKYGNPVVKRAYGDWTTANLNGWKDRLHKHAIQPIQQFAYTKGKNSSDSAAIIDAMDLLYAGNLDGFCIVSSDSDFTRLATRLRESGKAVFGLGEQKTPESFQAACDKFIFLEVLKKTVAAPQPGEAKPAPPEKLADLPDLRELLASAVADTERDNTWSPLSAVGAYLNRKVASFDPRNYGFEKLGALVRAQDYLEADEKAGPTGTVHLYVRLKR